MATENRTVNAGKTRSNKPLFAGRARQGTVAAPEREQQTASQPAVQAKAIDQKTTANNHKARESDELTGMRRRLFLRIALAGLVMFILLGGMIVADYYSSSTPPAPDKVPESVVQAPAEAPKALPPAVEIPPPVVAEVVDDTPVVLELTAPPVTTAPPPPEVSAQPRLPASAATSANSRNGQTSSRSKASSAEESKPSGKRPSQAQEQASTEALPATQLAPPRLVSGYALQAGVFADPKRAEELYAKLKIAGIPSSIETRVQVGPFKNRAEAETAKKKLAAMGIGSILLPQAKPSKHGSSSGK